MGPSEHLQRSVRPRKEEFSEEEVASEEGFSGSDNEGTGSNGTSESDSEGEDEDEVTRIVLKPFWLFANQ
jgi:ribosomal RNA-processing protein 36